MLKPQNVWEIVDFGLENEQYAVQATSQLERTGLMKWAHMPAPEKGNAY